MTFPDKIHILVITLSDRAYAGVYPDQSGPAITRLAEEFFLAKELKSEIQNVLLPDDPEKLTAILKSAINSGFHVVFTTGGTGLGPRDMTPDVVKSLLDKEIPGIMEGTGRPEYEKCVDISTAAALKEMIIDIDYENWIRQNSSSEKACEYRMSNVWFLIEALKNTLERDEEGEMTIEEAIAKLVLRDMLERQEEDEDGAEGVQMMTLHASKGLEFPSVYIMGMEEEILPHRSSIEADTIEEERRLAYVGITRARRNLTFTFASKRKQYGETIDCIPSRFLDELPAEDLQWEGLEEAPVEVKAARGNDALANIRALLKK